MCKICINFIFHMASVHPAVMGTWCTDPRLDQQFPSTLAPTHPELSGCITTLTVRNTGGCELLCSNGHLDRSRWRPPCHGKGKVF